jgi:hypothetical protein
MSPYAFPFSFHLLLISQPLGVFCLSMQALLVALLHRNSFALLPSL